MKHWEKTSRRKYEGNIPWSFPRRGAAGDLILSKFRDSGCESIPFFVMFEIVYEIKNIPAMKKSLLMFGGIAISAMVCGQNWTPEMTDIFKPVPRLVTPGTGTEPPSDAVVLFDGTNLDQWEKEGGGPAGWEVRDGIMTVVKGTGSIRTRQGFGDVQLHIEWRSPAEVAGEGQGRGNSGVYLQSLYELQVLDSYDNPTYVNGQAGAVYKQHIPLVNACRPPGKWQTYDIIFTAPRFKEDGSLFSPATLTVLQNGVLIQNHVTLLGPTENIGLPSYKMHELKLPLMLQDHGNPVSYRNIWIREL
jgi:hypothetical protein